MLELTEDLRFYFYNGRTNMRGGYRRLCETIRTEMRSDPANTSNVYVFMNRRCTIVRMLHYERGFYVLYEKRPSQGRFRKPVFDSRTGRYKISYSDLLCLTEGLTRTEIHMREDVAED